MTDAAELRELEAKLTSLKDKKSQLDTQVFRHEMELKSAKESLEASLTDLKELGFTDIASAEKFIDDSAKELKDILNKATNKIEGIAIEA